MSEPATPEPMRPICPYCGEDPCLPDMLDATYGNILVKIFVCPKCRKLFNVSTVGRRDPRIVGVQGQPA
jgi:ssDNA-binding Zn-finger/Zn-ribbon topoisomerase 1